MLAALQKCKTFIDTKKFVISFLALALLIGLFFIPFEAGEPASTYNTSIFDLSIHTNKLINRDPITLSGNFDVDLAITLCLTCLIVYFTSLILTVAVVIISRKKHIFVLSTISIALLLIWFSIFISIEATAGAKPYYGFYIILIVAVLYVLYVAMALIVKYVNPRDKTPRTPKTRKLTNKERIAELEKQVEELKKIT